VSVEDGDERGAAARREELLEDRALVVPLPGPRLVRAEEEVCAGDADDVGPDAVRVEPVGGRERLGSRRAHDRDGHRGALGAAEGVPACDNLPAAPISRRRVGWDLGQRLVDGSRRQAEVGRAAGGFAEIAEGSEQAPLGVQGEGGLPRGAPGLLQTDRRGDDRLVRPALGSEGHAGRGADEDRLALRVDTE
jgi:hypothetical protein